MHACTLQVSLWGFPSGSAGEESICSAGDSGDTDLIPGSGRSPGGGKGNQLQCSRLENPSQSLGSLTGSASCPLPCQMVLSSLCFLLSPHAGLSSFWVLLTCHLHGEVFPDFCQELECPPPHKLCLSPSLLYSDLTI